MDNYVTNPCTASHAYVLELDSALTCLLRLMEDWGTGGGLQGAGAALAVGLLPCSGVSATSVISTPPEDPAYVVGEKEVSTQMSQSGISLAYKPCLPQHAAAAFGN